MSTLTTPPIPQPDTPEVITCYGVYNVGSGTLAWYLISTSDRDQLQEWFDKTGCKVFVREERPSFLKDEFYENR